MVMRSGKTKGNLYALKGSITIGLAVVSTSMSDADITRL